MILRASFLSAMLLALPLALYACGGGEEPPDQDLQPSELFGQCVDDSQCPGVNSVCRSAARDGWPGGFCTIPCFDRTPCEVRDGEDSFYNSCLQRPGEAEAFCENGCRTGIDCGRPDTLTCSLGASPDGSGICIPVCSVDEQCGDGAFCNPFSGECQAEPFVDPAESGLEITGGPCDADSDCASGFCIVEGTPTQPSGWVRGYCASNCILPAGYNTNDYYFQPELPQGTCAGDAICSLTNSRTRGDLGICFDACRGAGDCREGYVCQQGFQVQQGGPVFTFENGICVAGDCGPGGVTCPSGYACVSNGTRSVCAPN